MDQNPFGEEMALSIQNLQGYVWVVQGNEGKIFHPELRLLLWLHQRQADPSESGHLWLLNPLAQRQSF